MTDTSKIIAAVATVWEALRERHPELPEVSVAVATTGAPHDLRYEERDRLTGVPTPPELAVTVDTLAEGADAVLDHLLHVATHALCAARGIVETNNRGRRHNAKFAAMARELGCEWPAGQNADRVRGFSPVPVTDEARAAMRPYAVAIEQVLQEAGPIEELAKPVDPVRAATGRVTLLCHCDERRTFQIGRRVAAKGPIICGVCREEFAER